MHQGAFGKKIVCGLLGLMVGVFFPFVQVVEASPFTFGDLATDLFGDSNPKANPKTKAQKSSSEEELIQQLNQRKAKMYRQPSLPFDRVNQLEIKNDLQQLKQAFGKLENGEQLAEKLLYNPNPNDWLPGTILIAADSAKMNLRYGHAAIVAKNQDGKKVVVEAPGEGEQIRTVPIDQWLKAHKYWTAYVVKEASNHHYEQAAQYALQQVGKEYNLSGLVSGGKDDEDEFYCSQLVWRAWMEQGFDIDGYSLRDTVYPMELVLDSDLVPFAYSPGLYGIHFSKVRIYKDKMHLVLTKVENSLEFEVADCILDLGQSDCSIHAWQDEGKKYSVELIWRKGNAAGIELTISDYRGAKILKKYTVEPGKQIPEFIGTPVGMHQLTVKCKEKGKCSVRAHLKTTDSWKLDKK